MLYEIRNYHYDPNHWAEYNKWSIEKATPFFKGKWDVVGVLVDK
jgi:hypothetical protein